MKIGIISSSVPFVNGGYRMIVEWLAEALKARGHDVETLYIPNTDDPDTILQQMAMFGSIRLEDYYERVITLRPPAHVVSHPAKVVWFIHHVRIFYDLWGHEYSPMADRPGWRALRDRVVAADTRALVEARRVFTNSKVVSERLQRYNAVPSKVLYPPVSSPERFRSEAYGDEIICVCRMEPHKRQHLLVEAMAHTRTQVRLRLCGRSLSPSYIAHLRDLVARHDLADRVVIEEDWITERRKEDLLAGALANAYVPLDEDSYGYPTLEAAHSRRSTVTVSDSGGVPEFVRDGVTGLITEPDAVQVADAFDRLFLDRGMARRLGDDAFEEVGRIGITWDRVAEQLLS